MRDVDEFLRSELPRVTAAETALHNGDAGPRKALWSHHDPVTLFGAAFVGSGWAQIEEVFDRLAARFSHCESWEWEVVGAGVGDGLAYVVAIERTTAAVAGGPPASYALRTTTIFRREDGEWKVVHRHGDPYDAAAAPLVARMQDTTEGG